MKKHLIIGGIGLLIVILLVLLVRTSKNNNGLLKTTLIPTDASITINKQKYHTESISLPEGKYGIEVSRAGFTSKKYSVNIQSKKTLNVVTILDADSPIGTAWLDSHRSQVLQAESVAGSLHSQSADSIGNYYPLINKLPILDLDYRIDYGKSRRHAPGTMSIAIYIKAPSPAGRANALARIKDLGFDVSDYEIIFSNLGGD